jgi:hypothetical protein
LTEFGARQNPQTAANLMKAATIKIPVNGEFSEVESASTPNLTDDYNKIGAMQ